MRLYEVRLKGGRSHTEFATFLSNAADLGAKAPDFSGISSVCLVAHTQDAETLKVILSRGLASDADITIKEITAKTLASGESGHAVYSNLVDAYFRPYHKFLKL